MELRDQIDALEAEREALREALELAVPQLQRLADIIDGRHEARLVPPHGQSSAMPHAALDRARAALEENEA